MRRSLRAKTLISESKKTTGASMELASIIEKLQQFQNEELIGNALAALKECHRNQTETVEQLRQDGRRLHIGIIGQMKAGKSSFINALLFGGKNFLPHAATPMTAALTRLEYSEQPRADFDFYSKSEWLYFVELHDRYEKTIAEAKKNDPQFSDQPDAPVNVVAAWELVQLARKNNLDIERISSTEHALDLKSTNKLFVQLHDYVGADGRYTPFVKSVTLHLNIPELENIVLIDTPGTNDPVLSRGERTREYLKQCDVVFVLSRSGRFLDAVDMGLIQDHLGDAGISRIELLGSQFDSALTQDFKKYGMYKEQALLAAFKGTSEKLSKQAEINLQTSGMEGGRRDALQKALPPQFISSHFHNLATKPREEWDASEAHTFGLIGKRYPAVELSTEMLLMLGNIDKQKKTLLAIRADKDAIQQDKIADFMAQQSEKPKKVLAECLAEVGQRIDNLKNNDIASLKKQQELLEKKLRGAESTVDIVFDDAITAAKRSLLQLVLEIKKQGTNVKTQVNKESESYRSGTTGMWWWKKDVYSTRTYSSASVLDAIDDVKVFANNAEVDLIRDIDGIIKIDQLKKALITNIQGLFDLGDENFDLSQILHPVHKAVNKISVPSLSFDFDPIFDSARQAFSSNGDNVRDDEVGKLRSAQRKAVEQVVAAIARQVDAHSETTMRMLEGISQQFIEDLLADSREENVAMAEDLGNREQRLLEYEAMRDVLSGLNT
jgi:hypothetical protein